MRYPIFQEVQNRPASPSWWSGLAGVAARAGTFRFALRGLAVLALALVAAATAAGADVPKVKRSAAPAWVEPVPVDFSALKKRADVDTGKNMLLFEQQVNVAEETRYAHFATQFLTEGAVEEGARISITFDPSYESLTFHRLIVHRDGKALDRLAHQEIKVLQREGRLDWHLYDGRLSGVIILEDIRVGDVLEYAYTIRGRNPIFGGRFMASFDTNWGTPLHQLRYRLLWPPNRQLAFKSHGRALEPKVTPRNGVTEYVWEDREVPAMTTDGELPSWFDPWGWVQLSEFDSWGAVARWAAAIHTVPTAVPDELEKALKQIALAEKEQDRILAALRYVQDNIRYLGVEVGENAHKPYPIETILARRFGDCKDKTLLLCTMLRRLGFEAYPALVETDSRQAIAGWLPTALAFDHVVVQLRFHGTEIWLDPTDRDQGGSLEHIYFPAYGQALVVSPETTALTPVRPGGFDEAVVELVETFEFANFGGPATLRVQSTWRGNEADNIRSHLADSNIASIQKADLNHYARLYPRVEVLDAPTFRDDRTGNVIVKDEAFRLTEFWKTNEESKGFLFGSFTSQTMRNRLDQPTTRLRTMPFALSYPKKATHIMEIHFPRPMNFKKEQTVIDGPSFKFTYSLVPSGKKLTLNHTYEAKKDHVPAADLPKYLANVDRARDLLSYEVSVPLSWAATDLKPTPTNIAAVPAVAAVKEAAAPTGNSRGATTLLVMLGIGAVALGYWWRHAASKRTLADTSSPLHRCVVCGETEESNSSLEFRVGGNGHDYCSRHFGRK